MPDAAVIAIVTAYEEGDRLPDTLAALRRALPDARVLVADDGSTDDTPRVAVEAAVPMTWYRVVGDRGEIVGIDHLGASADYQTLYEKFGLTADRVVAAARSTLAKNQP